MNIALRKLALLEKTMLEKEEEAKIQGYTSCPIDKDFQTRITNIMDKIRLI